MTRPRREPVGVRQPQNVSAPGSSGDDSNSKDR